MISSNTATTETLVNLIAGEMAVGVEKAVDCWMAQVEQAMTDPRLTTLGRVNAVKQVLETYKKVTGKQQLESRA
jgi:hypothetical protein